MAAKSNAERQKEWRERQSLKKNQQASSTLVEGNTPATGEPVGSAGPVAGAAEPDEQVTVTVNAPAPEETQTSVKGWLFGKGKQGVQQIHKPAATRKSSSKGKRDVTLISQLLPTMLAGVLMAFVRDRLPEEYRPCAPTQQEAARILRPLFEEIARYVEVTGKVSETTYNLTQFVVASMAYGARAYCTYIEIKHNQEKGIVRHEQISHNQQPGRPEPDYERGYRGDQSAAMRSVGNDAFRDAGDNGRGHDGDASGAGANLHDGSEQPEQSDASRVADMFKRDRAGRVKLGLLAS